MTDAQRGKALRLVTMALLATMSPKIIGWLTRHQTSAHDPVAATDRRMVTATAS